MIVRNGWAFIHNPKTGGSSIAAALTGCSVEDADCGRLHVHGKHAPLSKLKAKEGLLTFGFVRNPWDRQASMYEFVIAKAKRQGQPLNGLTFKRWLLDCARWLGDESRDLPPLQRRPQAWWIEDCAFVGRFERLQADFDALCTVLGLPTKPLQCIKATPHAPYQDYYDDETSAAVAQWFAPDIARWGYEFEGRLLRGS